MANAEDRELENILVSKEAPKRVEAKPDANIKKAKLTGRTIKSLREKIKDGLLNRAYAKYNKKYQKMKRAAIDASNAQKLRDEGEITDSELTVDYSIVASYDKKLAKMGAKLLKNDIKAIAASMDVSDKAVVGKRIKVPRFLLTKMKGLVAAIERIKTKNEQRKIAKKITKETKEYIKSSLDGALFKEDGTLQEKINADVIKNLSLKGGVNDTEKRLDTLRGFISIDGKTSMFEEEDAVELEKESKVNTGVPPIKPEATVEKEEPKVNVDDLLKGFTKKPVEVETELKKETVEEKAPVKVDENIEKKVSVKEEPVAKTPSITPQKQEIEDILERANRINQLRSTLKKTTDPEVRSALESKLNEEKEEFNNIIKADTKPKTKKEESKSSIEPITIEEPKKTKSVEDKTSDSMVNVEVKKPESLRVSQVSNPSALRVTAQDIKNLEERNKNAQLQIAQLRREKEELENQKEMLKEFIAKANMTREAEIKARTMAESNATLKGEVAELSSQASEIQSTLGRAK